MINLAHETDYEVKQLQEELDFLEKLEWKITFSST